MDPYSHAATHCMALWDQWDPAPTLHDLATHKRWRMQRYMRPLQSSCGLGSFAPEPPRARSFVVRVDENAMPPLSMKAAATPPPPLLLNDVKGLVSLQDCTGPTAMA